MKGTLYTQGTPTLLLSLLVVLLAGCDSKDTTPENAAVPAPTVEETAPAPTPTPAAPPVEVAKAPPPAPTPTFTDAELERLINANIALVKFLVGYQKEMLGQKGDSTTLSVLAQSYLGILLDHGLQPEQFGTAMKAIGADPALRQRVLNLAGKKFGVPNVPADVTEEQIVAFIKNM